MRKIQFGLLTLSLILLGQISILAQVDHQRRNEYRGKLGNEAVGLTIFTVSHDLSGEADNLLGNLEAVFFYVKDLKDVPLKGVIKDNGETVFRELDESGKTIAEFRGHIDKNLGKITGSRQKIGDPNKIDFTLEMEYACGIDGINKRYSVIDVKDDLAFEKSVQGFRTAVLTANKKKAAEFISFPVNTYIGRKLVEIKNKAAFLQNYDRIFDRAFIKDLRQTIPHNMFTKSTGAMLGNGLVWFDGDGKVIGIN